MDEFPNLITKELSKYGINHTCYYRSYTKDSIYPEHEHNVIPGDYLSDTNFLKAIQKRTKKYKNVIYHTHSYYSPNKINRLTFLNKHRNWYVTEHRITNTNSVPLKRIVRVVGRKVKLQPTKVFGVSKATV